jgi:DNA (cytosine-5)-methyltransferase 1
MARMHNIEYPIATLKAFLMRRSRTPSKGAPTAVSLFSGAGISDMGYCLAGFRVAVQVEMQKDRAEIGEANFPGSKWIVGDVSTCSEEICATYQALAKTRLSLLVATPPCQGMSSSNPSRGKRSTPEAHRHVTKNSLILSVVPIARALRPRVIVSENVRQILTLKTEQRGSAVRVLDLLAQQLPDYNFFETAIDVADYGVPQRRFRAVVVGVHRDEPWLASMVEQERRPWPKPTHGGEGPQGRLPWVSVREWLEGMQYAPLSSASEDLSRNGHPLHFVPHYDADRFLLVKSIPGYSGRSAYTNETCPTCGGGPVPEGLATCNACGKPMRNRPIVIEDGIARLIKGFDSSYRRMRAVDPSPTVTTNSSHIGSDNKIHPWEDRVLSILEVADLQTVPRFFDWSVPLSKGKSYLVRNVIGEALPTYFAYLHGRTLLGLLAGKNGALGRLASAE